MRDPTLAARRSRMTASTPTPRPPASSTANASPRTCSTTSRRRSMRAWPPASRGPGLAVVLVGNDPASSVYVRNKRRAAQKVGIRAIDYDLPADTSDARAAGADRPAQRRSARSTASWCSCRCRTAATPPQLIHRIDPGKDVDGFHPENVGHLALRQFGLRPCTPRGITTLLAYTDRPVRGAERDDRRRLQPRRPADGAGTADRRLHRDQLPQVHPAGGAGSSPCATPTSWWSRSGGRS